ncbi:IS200/IS605 family transposase [Gloeobacter kilaueensis]|uniref:Transposase IS200-family protein n=1 Tax=Gloeobacter kilaueensis (strain ATCC BAA-2537 / CCAP 1431/1 / ULC 316 / JS1) TaxID=1183438 RepID=U5QIU3_GLOK1|nr:IS200/IS605 family transposase [Gloeobacter kilaueensis]AGY57544.1 transposase IS200-family protein [Gloeobacter kilaueensis JS1]
MPYDSHSRAVSDLNAHIVLTTKYRRKVVSPELLARMTEIMASVCEKWGVEILEFNGEADHVHLLMRYYPQLQLSKFVNNVKTVTSRMLRKEFMPHIKKFYWGTEAFWNSSYFVASCGGVTVETLRKYVESQSEIPNEGDSSQS